MKRTDMGQARAALAALLLVAPMAATAWAPVGLHPIQYFQSHPLRIGGSASAYASVFTYHLRFDRYTSRQLQDVFVRTGAEYVNGSWNVEVCGASGCSSPVATQTVMLQPNAWNQITFDPPVPLAASNVHAGTPFSIVFTPVANAEIEFVALQDDGLLPTEVRTGLRYVPSGAYSYLKVEPPDTGPNPIPYSLRGVIVVTWAGLADPWAPSTCPGAILAEGNPYFELRPIAVAPGDTVTQTVIPVPQSGSAERLEGGYSTTSPPNAMLEFQNPSGTTVQVTPYDGINACFLLEHIAPDPLHTVSTVPSASPFTIYGLAANPTPLPECDPVARATWGGSRGVATVGGASDPSMDLGIAFATFSAHPAFEDADGDGYGGAVDPCGMVGSSAIPGDCDDHDPGAYPGALERCNGRDDDCNGLVDTDDPDFVPDACDLQKGICTGAKHVLAQFADGGWSSCGASEYGALYEPDERACDGKDNDCDGQADEDLPLETPCLLQKGVCEGSRAPACVNGEWVQCSAEQYGPDYEPQETRCDGKDNDCDGLTDGDDPELPRPYCEVNVGVCAATRKPPRLCGANGWAVCAAEDYGSDHQVIETRCDDLDNDCDGVMDWYDSDFREVPCEKQVGVCAGKVHSWWQCEQPSGWSACGQEEYGPEYEEEETSCDGLDNDCDGAADEGCMVAVAPDAGSAVDRPVEPVGCSAGSKDLPMPLLVLVLLVTLWRQPGAARQE